MQDEQIVNIWLVKLIKLIKLIKFVEFELRAQIIS